LGRHEEGLADRTKAIELDPKNAQTWYSRGSAYFLLKKYELAKLDLEQAKSLDPGNREYADVLDKTLEEMRAQNAARSADLMKAITRAGVTEAGKPPREAAPAAPKPAVKEEPVVAQAPPPAVPKPEAAAPKPALPAAAGGKSAEGHHMAGRALLQQGRFEEAMAELDSALEMNPKLALAWNARGYSKMRLGRYMDAVMDFDKALELNPGYANAKQNKEAAFRMMNPKP
jgi:tetratricopeptide (TPR) repeat protein